MKRIVKNVLLGIALFIVAFLVFLSMAGYNIVIPVSETTNDRLNAPFYKVKPGDTANLFSKYNFKKGNWTAYLMISPDDFSNLNEKIPKRVCLKTSDRDVLLNMQKTWKFKATGGDMATVESSFYLVHDNLTVFKTGIVLDKNRQGFQNSGYGWMEPLNGEAMINTCKAFKKVYWPVVSF